jgi:hypothetical protein
VERVSADSNFRDDLGTDSMVMPRFCARIRKRSDLAAVCKDGYRNPPSRALAVSQEDTTFNSDHFTIGPGCGVPIGDARWRGKPATEFRDHHGFAVAATIANARGRG